MSERFISPAPSVEPWPDIAWKNDADPQAFDGRIRPCGMTIKQGDWKYGQTVFRCDIYSCPNALCNHKRGCQRATPSWRWYEHVWAEAIGGLLDRKGCDLTREQYEALAKAGIAPKLD